jgi:acetylornithine deacetylase/succinyl-diaminopimelate desuccinylase-like protein
MKGGLASMLFAIQILMECGLPLDGTISFSITPDEETGGMTGLKYLLDSGHINRDILGVLDPEPSGGGIINGSRGALSMEVVVKGRPSHVMLQHMGVNAFEKMVRAASAFLELKNDVEKRVTRCQVKPPGTAHSILHIGGMCGGGINFNIVPDRAFFTVDRRFNPEEKMAEAKRELEECVSSLRAREIEIETRIFQEGESSLTAEDEPVCQALSRAVEGVLGRRPEIYICPGLLETRFFVEQGIPAVIYGPGLLERAHHPEEYVGVEDLSDCAAIFALTAAELLGKDAS